MIVKDTGYNTLVSRIAEKKKNNKVLLEVERLFDKLYKAKKNKQKKWVSNAEFANDYFLRYAVHIDKLRKTYNVNIIRLKPLEAGSRQYRYMLGDN